MKAITPPRLLKIEDWETLARQAGFHPADMAALCPISLRQMQRFFAANFEKTPSEWARELRCRLARQLIAEGWSSKAVVLELGFFDGSHLSREFRHFHGAPPQAFAPSHTLAIGHSRSAPLRSAPASSAAYAALPPTGRRANTLMSC